MKKGIIIFIILALAGIGLWLERGSVRFWDGLKPASQTELSEGQLNSEPKATSSPVVSIQAKEKAALQARASIIVSKPISVRAQLADLVKNQAIDKIKQVSELIKADYDLDSQWLELAAYRKLIGDYDGAIEAWDFLSLIRPQNYISYNNLGDLYAFTLKDYDRGEQNFLKSISNNPENVNAYMQLVTIYEATIQPNKIEPLLLSGIKSNSANPTLNILLARYYAGQKRFNEALAYYEAAARLDPNNQPLEDEMIKFIADQGL